MTTKEEYIELLDLFAQTVESIRGQKIPEGYEWMNETQGCAIKLFHHLGSLYYLSNGTSLPPLMNHEISYIDVSSMIVILRSAFETYLAFNYVYVSPSSSDDRLFRYLIWDLGGLIDRQSFAAVEPENVAKKESEKILVKHLQEKIINMSQYKTLSKAQMNAAINGDWKLGQSWADLAEKSGIDKGYFKSTYRYLCAYSHTGNLSIFQLSQLTSQEDKIEFADTWLSIGLVVMSHFICDYITVYPSAKKVLDDNPKASDNAYRWNSIGHSINNNESAA